MNFLGHKQHTTATTRVSRRQTVKPCLLMMLVPLILQTLGGQQQRNARQGGQTLAIACFKEGPYLLTFT